MTNKTAKIWNEGQEGSAMVVVLMVLILLTLLGASATDKSIMESKISANDREYQDSLVVAHSALSYVLTDREDLYVSNIDFGEPKSIGWVEGADLGMPADRRFTGSVTVLSSGNASGVVFRDTGMSVGKVDFWFYAFEVEGRNGTRDNFTRSRISSEGYRLVPTGDS